MSALKENNPDLAYKIVSDAIDSSIQKFSTGQMIEQYIFYILQILDDAIKDLPQNGNDILYQCNNPYTSLIPFSGIEELKQKIKDYLHKVSLLMAGVLSC